MTDNKANLSRFARVPFDIQVEIDRLPLRVADLLNLKPGTVLTLHKPAGDRMDVLVGGTRIGSGEVVMAGNSVGVRLTMIEGN